MDTKTKLKQLRRSGMKWREMSAELELSAASISRIMAGKQANQLQSTVRRIDKLFDKRMGNGQAKTKKARKL